MRFHRKAAALLLLLSAGLANAAPGASTKLTGPGYSFEYSYPPVVETIPALQQRFEEEKQQALEELKQMGADWLKDDPERASEIDLETQIHWQTVANLPAYLSLTQGMYSYTGGAHGIYGRGSLIWDRRAAVAIDPVDMFTSKAAFDGVVQTPFCDKLDIERSKRREGAKVDRRQSDDWMQACPAPSEYTIILGSSDGKRFNRFAVYVGPYGAGPYSEGDYEIDMAVTRALLALVKPAYRASFAVTPAKAGKRK